MPTFSVIVPCYNEEAVLAETHRRLSKVLLGMGESYEILYVDDGSRDATAQKLTEISQSDPNVRVIRFARNAGHQIAVTAGLDYAAGDAVVIIDADLQDPPEVIPEMAEKWRSGAQVVYGQRRKRAGETWLKRFTAFAFYRLLRALTGTQIPPDTGDFRLADRKAADAVRGMREHARFLRGMFAWVGFRQEAVFYDRDKRFAGKTHYTLKKMTQLALDGLFSFSDKPLKLAAYTGFFWTAAGLLWALVLLILSFAGIAGGILWICALLCVLAGNILLALGIAGEYLGRVYDEARARPLYIVAETIGFPKK